MANTDTQIQAIWTAVENSNAEQLSKLIGNAEIVKAFNRADDDRDYLLLIVQAVINSDDRVDILDMLCKAFPTVKDVEAGRIFKAFFSEDSIKSENAESSKFKAAKFLYIANLYIGSAKIDNSLWAQNVVRFVIEQGDQALLEKCLQNQHLTRVITKEFKEWFVEVAPLQAFPGPNSSAEMDKMNVVTGIIVAANDTNSTDNNADRHSTGASNESTDSINTNSTDNNADRHSTRASNESNGNISASSEADISSESNETSVVNCHAALSTIDDTHALAPLMKAALAVTSLNRMSHENINKAAYNGILSAIKSLPKPLSGIDNFTEVVSALTFMVISERAPNALVPESLCINSIINNKGVTATFIISECKLDFAPLLDDRDDCEETHDLYNGAMVPSTAYGAVIGIAAALAGVVYCGDDTHSQESMCKYLM